jgi:hypothetical protein
MPFIGYPGGGHEYHHGRLPTVGSILSPWSSNGHVGISA